MEQSKFYQIKNVAEHEYTLVGCDGSVITRPIQDVDKLASTFTIQDAKDGDLIYVSTEEKGIQAIFHEYKNGIIFFHCYLCADFVQGDYMPIGSVELVYPLQKSNYNRFFEKMHEAGYEWSADRKELKKIENTRPLLSDFFKAEYERGKADAQKSATWSEEDKKKLNRIYMLLAEAADEHAFSTTCRLIGDKECVELQDFLRSLKPQTKQEWSEEDERAIGIIKTALEHPYDMEGKWDRKFALDWLKSLKDRVGCEANCTTMWKPSEEQIHWLKWAVNTMPDTEIANEAEAVLEDLLEQLKKL